MSGALTDRLEVIIGRRSTRAGFSSQPVPAAVVDAIVAAGLHAPSSKNAQPWCLHVVTRRELLADIAALVEGAKNLESFVPIDPVTGRPRREFSSTVVESAEVLRQVPLAVFLENRALFSDGRRSLAVADRAVLANALLGYSLEMIGFGAAIENMWLAAEAHGVGGVFMGDVLVAEDDIRARLDMRGDLVGVLALGVPDGEPQRHPKVLKADRVRRHE